MPQFLIPIFKRLNSEIPSLDEKNDYLLLKWLIILIKEENWKVIKDFKAKNIKQGLYENYIEKLTKI